MAVITIKFNQQTDPAVSPGGVQVGDLWAGWAGDAARLKKWSGSVWEIILPVYTARYQAGSDSLAQIAAIATDGYLNRLAGDWRVDPVSGGGGGGGGGESYALVSTTPYTRAEPTTVIDVDASAGNIAISLGTAGTVRCGIRKLPTDNSFNTVTITYGAQTLVFDSAGQSALFIPSGGSWLLWEQSF